MSDSIEEFRGQTRTDTEFCSFKNSVSVPEIPPSRNSIRSPSKGLLDFGPRRWRRSGESRGVDRDVWLHLAKLSSGLPVRPGRSPAKGYLDSRDLAIVTVVSLRGNAAGRRIDKADQPHQQTGFVEIEIYGRLPGVDSLDNSDLAIVDGSRADPPLGKRLFDLCWKRQKRIDSSAYQITSGQRHQRHWFVWPGDPTRAAVVDPDAVSDARMDDRGALSRSFGKDFHRDLRLFRLEPYERPPGGIAGKVGQPLPPAECLDILVKNLIGGRPPRNGKDFNFIWIFDRRRVLRSKIRHDPGA